MALSDWSEKQLLALTAGVVGAILLVMGGLDAWVYLKYDALRDQITAKRAEKLSKEKEAKKLEDVQQQHAAKAADAHRILRRLPEDSDLSGLMVQIANQARAAKVRLTKLGEKKATTGRRKSASRTRHKPRNLELRLEGGYHSLGKFLCFLEDHQKTERFLEVTGFTISAYKDGLVPGEEKLDITLNLVTYTYGTQTKN